MVPVCAMCLTGMRPGLRPEEITHTLCTGCKALTLRDAGILPETEEAAAAYLAFWSGGISARKRPSLRTIDPNELRLGIETELEHGPDRETAAKIALDHLAEIPDYYSRLKAAGL